MAPSFKVLLFDLDGTLVDSSEVLEQIMKAWCLKHHLDLATVLAASHGVRTEDTIALVAPHLCARTEVALLDRLEGTSLDGLRPIPGAASFLSCLDIERWAVVTSSSVLTARPKLEACGMPLPSVLITAESVSRGKPHPEPYSTAAAALSCNAADCLVFEDADSGVTSALDAGCKVIAVGDLCTMEHENIIARINSFVDLDLTDEGHLRVRDRIIATCAGLIHAS